MHIPIGRKYFFLRAKSLLIHFLLPVLYGKPALNHFQIMNTTQLKCLSVFAIFALIGFGPISPGCLIGLFIVIRRPMWFLKLTENLYSHPPVNPGFITTQQTRRARIKSFFTLLTLFLIDIAPVPVTPVIAFVIILARPRWFHDVVRTVYGDWA